MLLMVQMAMMKVFDQTRSSQYQFIIARLIYPSNVTLLMYAPVNYLPRMVYAAWLPAHKPGILILITLDHMVEIEKNAMQLTFREPFGDG